MKYLSDVWLSGSEEESKAVRAKLDEKIDSYAAGKLEHAVDVVSSMWEISDKGSPSDPDPAPGRWVSLWKFGILRFAGCNMRPSLIKSIKEGYLLDRKNWARRSREGAIEPIYFSSTVAKAELLYLDTRESPHPRVH